MTDDAYLTVARASQAETEVKRSRFLATVEPVDTEEQARAVVARLRTTYWDARHHCSAFILGPTGSVERSSDDGEPSGTAGAPMLDVLRGAAVKDVVVVVTRWFGGTLLGAGGLVRAYSDACRAGLELAGIHERRRLREHSLTLDHADAARVESELRQRGYVVLSADYTATVTLRIAAPATAPIISEVEALTAGRITPVPGEEIWTD